MMIHIKIILFWC